MSVEATSNSKPRIPASEPGLRLAARSSLDVMLSDAVLKGGGVGRFVKRRATCRTLAGLRAIRGGPRAMRVASASTWRVWRPGAPRLGRRRAIVGSASWRGRTTGYCAG